MSNRLFFVLTRTVLVVASVWALTSCIEWTLRSPPAVAKGTPEPFPCRHFVDFDWKEFQFGKDTQDEVIAKVSRFWERDQDSIRFHEPEFGTGIPQLSWEDSTSGVRHFAKFNEEGMLRSLYFFNFWTRADPTLGQTLACFGRPDFYSSYSVKGIEYPLLHLEIWYVDRGIVLSHSSYLDNHRRFPPPPFPPELYMHLMEMVQPGDVEEMVAVALEMATPGRLEYVECLLKPWPGSIEAMEIEDIGWGYPLPPTCEEPTQ